MFPNTEHQYDIVIVGGGLVGAAMGCALRSLSYKVALIDSTPLNGVEDHRLIALNHRSIALFKNLGLWDELKNNATAIHEVHVSHAKHFGITRLKASDVNLSELGHVIPAKYINATLYAHLDKLDLFRPASLKNLTHADQPRLTIETSAGEKTLSATVVIGADGTHSTVRELLHISTEKVDYEQKALVTMTKLQRSHSHIAYERFLDEGAIAMLPLADNVAATIWTGNNTEIAHLMKLSDEEFLFQLQQKFGYRLGKLIKTHPRYTYPLHYLKATQKVKGQVILLGNAAHTLHPIAAQGLNLALFEVAALADYFSSHPLEKITLKNFAEQKEKVSSRLSHSLTSIFMNDFVLVKTLRQIGMVSMDLMPSLKKQFIRYTMGNS